MSENWDDSLGKRDVSPEEEGQADIHLDDPEDTDDVAWSPPDKMPVTAEFMDDVEEETIDQRIAQEEPEEGTAYGAPESGGVLGGADDLTGEGFDGRGPDDRDMAGGDDPDAIPADDDVLGGVSEEVADDFGGEAGDPGGRVGADTGAEVFDDETIDEREDPALDGWSEGNENAEQAAIRVTDEP